MCTKQSLHGQKFSLKLIFINKKRKENECFRKKYSKTNVMGYMVTTTHKYFCRKKDENYSKFGQIYRTHIYQKYYEIFSAKITFKELKNYKGKDDLFFFYLDRFYNNDSSNKNF